MSTADSIALSAAIVATCAFFITAWQTWFSWRHNRLSVRPLLVSHRDKSINNLGVEITITVRNYGVGPAIIKKRYFTIDGEVFEPKEPSVDEVSAVAEILLGGRTRYFLRQHGLPGIGAAIPQGGEHVIARVFFPEVTSNHIEDVLKQLAEVKMYIFFESLYGEPNELVID